MQPTIKLACIIVTYNPDLAVLQSLISQLLKSSVSVYIVDNRFSVEASNYVRALAMANHERITLIAFEKNHGIAKALNTGIEAAKIDHHDLAILLDQDSVPQDGLIEEMQMVAIKLAASGEPIAAIGPRLYDPRSQQFFKFALLRFGIWKKVACANGSKKLIPCEFINSSGSLIFLKHWHQIGSFREDFFIDHVETEWYMRVRALGLKCFGYCSQSYLEHHMGNDVCRYWLGKWRWMPRRSPQRHYTIIRNALWMWRLDHTPFAWKINSTAKLIFTFLYFSIFDIERKNQFRYILRGVRDGLFTGPL